MENFTFKPSTDTDNGEAKYNVLIINKPRMLQGNGKIDLEPALSAIQSISNLPLTQVNSGVLDELKEHTYETCSNE